MRKIFILIFMILSILYGHSQVFSLGDREKVRVFKNTKIYLAFNPKYKRGAQGKDFADCSGVLFSIFFDSGFPVLRTTAWYMAHGKYGWKSKTTPIPNVEGGDILFWHIYDYYSHTGLQYTKDTVAHASSTSGFIEVDMMYDNWTVQQLALRRRLTFGDER